MQDVVNMIVLVCAAVASLALGVMLAFAVCRAAFALLRMQSPKSGTSSPVAPKTQVSEA
jgi:hypothetical protein